MFLLLTTLLIFLSTASELVLDIDTWHRSFLEHYTGECETVIKKHANQTWGNLTEDSQGEIIHCLTKMMWLNIGKEDAIYPSTMITSCDEVMSLEWMEMDHMEKELAFSCSIKICATVYIKKSMPFLSWLPVNLFYDKSVEDAMVHELEQCTILYKQYKKDREGNFEQFSSPAIHKVWVHFGLSVAHYTDGKVINEESLAIFRDSTTIQDYIEWNNIKSCLPYEGITKLKKHDEDFFDAVSKIDDEFITTEIFSMVIQLFKSL